MTVNLSLLGGAGWQFFDNSGNTLVGGLLYTYAAGTTTPVTTYTSAAGNVANSNPIVLDSAGRVTEEIWLTAGVLYKFTLKTSTNVLIWEKDNIAGANDFSVFALPTGSSLIGYNEGSIGAVNRTVEKRLQDRVSVFDFIPNQYIAGIQARTHTTPTLETYIQNAMDSGAYYVYFPEGTYPIAAPIQLKPGMRVEGEAAGQFLSPDGVPILGTRIVNNEVDGGVFWMTDLVTAAQCNGPTIQYFNLKADYPIRINDPEGRIADSYSSGQTPIPYYLFGNISYNFLEPRLNQVGTAISLTKVFDTNVIQNHILSFDIGILSQGTDLSRIADNRVISCKSWSVLEIGVGTFGSQTVIEHNDLLAMSSTGVYIQSCAKHPRIYNNYMETGGCKGFVSLSTTDCPQYGPNVPSSTLSIIVRDNRCDGQVSATDYIYNFKNGPNYVEIHDSGTTGDAPSAPLFNIEGGVLQTEYNSVSMCNYDLSFPTSNDVWNRFVTGITPIPSNGIEVNAQNFRTLNNSFLHSNNASAKIYYEGARQLLLSTEAINAYWILPKSGSSLHPLEVGAVYDIYFTASSSTNESINVSYLYGNPISGGAATPLTLTASPTTYYAGTVTAPAITRDVGINVTKSATTGNIAVQSWAFVKRDVSATANNGQVVTVANVGPGGAAVSIQGWQTVYDQAGNVRYIPLFGA
jgi:hypothetical protein